MNRCCFRRVGVTLSIIACQSLQKRGKGGKGAGSNSVSKHNLRNRLLSIEFRNFLPEVLLRLFISHVRWKFSQHFSFCRRWAKALNTCTSFEIAWLTLKSATFWLSLKMRRKIMAQIELWVSGSGGVKMIWLCLQFCWWTFSRRFFCYRSLWIMNAGVSLWSERTTIRGDLINGHSFFISKIKTRVKEKTA